MLTFKDWVVLKSKRKQLTQEQRAQIPDKQRAEDIVGKMISDALMQKHDEREGLVEEDLDRIFDNQPVHFDGYGYVPHHFERQDIKSWGWRMSRYLPITKKTEAGSPNNKA